MRFFLINIALFIFLLGIILSLGFMYLIEPGPEGRANYLYTFTRLALYRHSIIDELSKKETKLLYESTCNRKCHGSDVIERTPRTAREWELIVARMKENMKREGYSGMTESVALAVTQYLQENYFSNTPTLLPDKIMRFLKKYLWRLDFGRGDIYFDIVYVSPENLPLLSYIGGLQNPPETTDNTIFFIFISTHTLELPQWDLKDLAVLTIDNGLELKPEKWEILYEDGGNHHKEGILTFPKIEKGKDGKATLDLAIKLPQESKERRFLWTLPVPAIVF